MLSQTKREMAWERALYTMPNELLNELLNDESRAFTPWTFTPIVGIINVNNINNVNNVNNVNNINNINIWIRNTIVCKAMD